MSPYTSNLIGRRFGESEAQAAARQRRLCDVHTRNLQDPEHNDSARLFALQCLEESAKTHGADPGPVMRRYAGVRRRSDARYASNRARSPAHVEAVARLVSNIAERSFPQYVTFGGYCGRMAEPTDGTSAELCMMVLKTLQRTAQIRISTRSSRPDVATTSSERSQRARASLAVTYAYMVSSSRLTQRRRRRADGPRGEPAFGSTHRLGACAARHAAIRALGTTGPAPTPQHDFAVV